VAVGWGNFHLAYSRQHKKSLRQKICKILSIEVGYKNAFHLAQHILSSQMFAVASGKCGSGYGDGRGFPGSGQWVNHFYELYLNIRLIPGRGRKECLKST